MIDIKHMMQDHQSGHSDLQIDHFIVSKGNWTPYGRYKQCLREIASRHNALLEMREEAELAVLDLDDAKLALEREALGTPAAVRKRVACDRQRRRLESIHRTVATQQRELDRLVALATDLKQQVGELTDDRRAELDAELWSVRVRAMVALDMFTSGHLSQSTAELLIALPVEIRQPILQSAKNAEATGELFDWLEQGPRALPQ